MDKIQDSGSCDRRSIRLGGTHKKGVLAHLVERNTGSVEVSGSSPPISTILIKYQ